MTSASGHRRARSNEDFNFSVFQLAVLLDDSNFPAFGGTCSTAIATPPYQRWTRNGSHRLKLSMRFGTCIADTTSFDSGLAYHSVLLIFFQRSSLASGPFNMRTRELPPGSTTWHRAPDVKMGPILATLIDTRSPGTFLLPTVIHLATVLTGIRPRTMEPETEPTPLVRIPELWFADGGLVVKAQHTLFRVSRGILVLRSPIFADMFSMPQPSNAETIDGCPVVQLPDLAEDVNVFFKAMFDSSFFEPYPAQTTFKTIAGVLRLSTKYEVDYLRRRALVHFCSRFPTTLAHWDLKREMKYPAVPSWELSYEIDDAVALIALARQARARWILPCAFYELALACKTSGFFAMPEEEQRPLLDGYLLQRDAVWTIMQFLSDGVALHLCCSIKSCGNMKFAFPRYAHERCAEVPARPLTIWAEGDWEDLAEVCGVCRPYLRDAHQRARQDFWDRLPSLYGLGSWEELEAEKAAQGD
ncbi:hypothetical protein C8R46DRAFT_1347907 [Mycena filopes]|nr:hypothetical protein C8R46DRAFT_1347907 [Mycena filopes]